MNHEYLKDIRLPLLQSEVDLMVEKINWLEAVVLDLRRRVKAQDELEGVGTD